MQPEIIPIAGTTPFRFACTPQVPCFNACCHDLTQALSPYDVLCLKLHLKLSSRRFLEDYTVMTTGARSGLPVVTLKSTGARKACPFLTARGCRVYPARPSSCRIYPLMRVARRARRTGVIKVDYFLLRETHCRGFEQALVHTPATWETNQELAEYNLMNDDFLEIISLKNRVHPQPLNDSQLHDFYRICYDLDTFWSSSRPEPPELQKPDQAEKAAGRACLMASMRRIRRHLQASSPPPHRTV